MKTSSIRIILGAVAAMASLIVLQSAQAAVVYWDTNGATAGSGVTPNGTWGTDAYWSTASAGDVATSATGPTAADIAAFSAGFDAAGTYTVTLNGTQTAQTAYARSGANVVLSGGTLSLANTTLATTFNFQTNGARQLTVDSTVLVNNSVSGNNYLTFGSVNAANGTITINGTLTASSGSTSNKIFIRQLPSSSFATHVVFNSNLGSDANFKAALQSGSSISGASSGGTMTFNGNQDLGTTGINSLQQGGTLNFGSTVNTGNAVTIGTIIANSDTLDMSGTTINVNSAMTMSSTLNVRNGAVVNIAGSISTSGQNTFLGDGTAHPFHGGEINILNGGSGTFGAISVRDAAVFTNAGTMNGTLLTLGEATNNTSGTLALGDATGAGATTLTGLATAGSGTANKIVGGNSAVSTLTVNTASASTFNGVIGGAGTNENNVALVKGGASSLTLGGLNTYTGNTTVNQGTLTLADNATLAFTIGATGVNNGISGSGSNILALDGDFTFDLTNAAATGSWNIVDIATLGETFGSTFSVLGFTDAGSNLWTKINGGSTYTFDESTGFLSAVPEPATWALLAGAGTFLMVMRRRCA